jgi:hypothetical protein
MAVSYDHPPSPDFSAFPNIERTYCPQTLEIKNLSTLASWREKSCHSLDCVEVLARQWRETSEIVQLPVEAHRTFSDSEPPDGYSGVTSRVKPALVRPLFLSTPRMMCKQVSVMF